MVFDGPWWPIEQSWKIQWTSDVHNPFGKALMLILNLKYGGTSIGEAYGVADPFSPISWNCNCSCHCQFREVPCFFFKLKTTIFSVQKSKHLLLSSLLYGWWGLQGTEYILKTLLKSSVTRELWTSLYWKISVSGRSYRYRAFCKISSSCNT